MNATPQNVYAQRRAKLAALLGPKDLAIIPSAPEQRRNRDSDFLYRHDSYFYYRSGRTDPQSRLGLGCGGQSTLGCLPN